MSVSCGVVSRNEIGISLGRRSGRAAAIVRSSLRRPACGRFGQAWRHAQPFDAERRVARRLFDLWSEPAQICRAVFFVELCGRAQSQPNTGSATDRRASEVSSRDVHLDCDLSHRVDLCAVPVPWVRAPRLVAARAHALSVQDNSFAAKARQDRVRLAELFFANKVSLQIAGDSGAVAPERWTPRSRGRERRIRRWRRGQQKNRRAMIA